MIQKLPILLLLSFFGLAAAAQTPFPTCSNGRYVNNVFPGATKTVGIPYGSNRIPNYATNTSSDPVTLLFDFYQPTGDTISKRPLMILAFGGSFVSGQRSDLDAVCQAFAIKGYTVATIDYRLINTADFANVTTIFSNSAFYLADVLVKASADMKAAIRFFKKNAANPSYKIDTTKIFVGGYSAGAITALQTAYTDAIRESDIPATNTNAPFIETAYNNNSGLEGNTDLPSDPLLSTYNARGIAGVVNIAGGVGAPELIDANNPPIYSAQGDADLTVPYNSGVITVNGFPTAVVLYGSNAIRTRANNISLNNQLLTIAGGDHASPTQPPNLVNIINGAAAFLQPIVCAPPLPVLLTTFSVENSNCAASLKWQTASESKSSRYEVEVSTDGKQFMKVGVVLSKNVANGASYSYTYKSFNGTSLYRLKMIDVDGSYTYSPVQKLNLPCNLTTVQVYPNPAKDQTLVTGLKQGMQVQLLNAQGQKLWLQKAGNSALQIPLNQFTNGLYLVQVSDESGKVISNTKLMKE